MAARRLGEEEGVIGQAEEERGLLLDLPDRVFDRRSVGIGKGTKVEGDDGNAV